MKGKEERRSSLRWIKGLVVSYSTLEGEKVTDHATTENIGEGGLQILLVHKLERTESVEIQLELVHDSIPIVATCKVIYVTPEDDKHRTGLQFVKIEDFQKERLLRYLREGSG